MVLSDNEGVLVHWNGKEIAFITEYWDVIYLLEKIASKVSITPKPITFINIDMCEIDISEEANAELILNYLYKNTDLQVSYNFNVVTIDNRTPRLTGILDILDSYIEHQKDVVLRRSRYDYNKCADRLHIDEGLIKAISILPLSV